MSLFNYFWHLPHDLEWTLSGHLWITSWKRIKSLCSKTHLCSNSAVRHYKAKGLLLLWQLQQVCSRGVTQTEPCFKLNSLHLSQRCVICRTKPGQRQSEPLAAGASSSVPPTSWPSPTAFFVLTQKRLLCYQSPSPDSQAIWYHILGRVYSLYMNSQVLGN